MILGWLSTAPGVSSLQYPTINLSLLCICLVNCSGKICRYFSESFWSCKHWLAIYLVECNSACHPHTWPLDAFWGLLGQFAGFFWSLVLRCSPCFFRRILVKKVPSKEPVQDKYFTWSKILTFKKAASQGEKRKQVLIWLAHCTWHWE